MKVLHITPTYFNDRSVIGGGERFPQRLAEAQSRYLDTTLLSFGPENLDQKTGNLTIKVLKTGCYLRGRPTNPLAWGMFREIMRVDIVHCHQYHTFTTNLAILFGRLWGKKIYVSDLGGWGENLLQYFNIGKYVTGFLLISEFSRSLLDPPGPSMVVYGGADLADGEFSGVSRRSHVLYVGRLLPHKGINYLVAGADAGFPLHIVGRAYDAQYYDLLVRLAAGKNVRFITKADDEELIRQYRHALVTVLPSVYEDLNGTKHDNPELLGLAVLESMALGTPVICSKVASLPELVLDGVNGFLVAPNSPGQIAEKIQILRNNPGLAEEMGRRGREMIKKKFTWDMVARRCIRAYRDIN